ncbi:MAG: carboxypeptidase-like regulatory domain-containing protein, partial [Gemmatimonadaceae bacterium]
MSIIKRLFTRSSLLAVLLAVGASAANAQGVTTSSLTGTVLNLGGAPVAGARVTAIHQPSGTTYQGITRTGGRFTIPGMRVGGPYTVTARIIGFSPEVRPNVFLSLGVASDLAFTMR